MERLNPQVQDLQSQQTREETRHESAPARAAQGHVLERRSAIHLAAGGGIQGLPPREVEGLSTTVGNDALLGMMNTGGPVRTARFTLPEQTRSEAVNVIETESPGLTNPCGLCGAAGGRLPINPPNVRGRGLMHAEQTIFGVNDV